VSIGHIERPYDMTHDHLDPTRTAPEEPIVASSAPHERARLA
jgi:hypothetical protein